MLIVEKILRNTQVNAIENQTEVSPTLAAEMGLGGQCTDNNLWTDTKGKKHKPSASARYKALGNSICLPQWYWLAQKLKSIATENVTMASLFDGIGGFPLVFEETFGKGTAVWASEIEEFPIAVTKVHFPED